MKNLLLTITLFLGVVLSCGSSDYPVIYIPCSHAIFKAPEKVEINFERFASHLRLIESSGRYEVVNSIGCMGAYQFSASTLEILGYHNITPEKFKANPSIFTRQMQEQALRDLVHLNKMALKKFSQYIGTVVNGVMITEAGLLAACHLSGIGGVNAFFNSHQNFTDMNGTSVTRYLTEFQNYNV
jgi:hypothetical protein